ncbi:MAG: DUF2298 domain-containing protein [Methanocorpusculum sp.]|nr:DUF2298 domain-containing protein [Methanocorpusculum sp.]
MVPLESQICTIILWLVIIKFCQMTLYPYLKPAFEKLAYGLAYPTGILVLTLISWYLGLIHLPVQLVLIPFAILGGYALWKKMYRKEEIKENTKWDLIFFGIFAITLAFRIKLDNLAISTIPEQYMNAAFLGSIMNMPFVVPSDPWFSGENLSIYYYLGHWMMGVLGILSGGSHTVIFNLMLPTIFGLFAISLYAIGTLLLNRHRWLPLILLVIPNAATLWYLTKLGELGIAGVASNIIYMTNSVNPYPFYKILVGAPHAMIYSWFNQAFFLCLLMILLTKWTTLTKKGKYLLLLSLSLSLGTMPCMNTWDVFIYAPIYLIIGFIVWYKDEAHDFKKILPFSLVPILSILCYFPFLLGVLCSDTPVSGIGLSTSTDIVEFLGIYLFIVIIFVIQGLNILKKYPWLILIPVIFGVTGYATAGILLFCILLLLGTRSIRPETLFGIFGLCILFIIEFIFIHDTPGEGSQYNTMVKFGIAACIMLLLSAMLMIGKWTEKHFTGIAEKHIFAIIAIFFVIFLVAPLNVSVGDSFGYPNEGNLDGSAWLEKYHPADYQGIVWLSKYSYPGEIVVEAVGEDVFSYNSRVSVMTGMPTILGWKNHEAHWRNESIEIAERQKDVKNIYEDPDQTLTLMDKYNAAYLFVGESEHEWYNVSLPSSGIIEVFSADGVSIYRRSD